MAAQTFLYNNNENRFFLGESKCDKYSGKPCTVTYPNLDHLTMIDNLHSGLRMNMILTPQRPGTFYGSYRCRCSFLPPLRKDSKKPKEEEEVQDNKSNRGSRCSNVENTSNRGSNEGDAPQGRKSTRKSRFASVPAEDVTGDQPMEGEEENNTTKDRRQTNKSIFSNRRKSSFARRSKSPEKDVQLEEIKCLLNKLLDEKNGDNEDGETEYAGRRSTMRKPTILRRYGGFVPDECRKCTQKICLRCKMYLDSCCCGIPNFLYCRDCETKNKSPECSFKDPFACRKCDQKICLVCKELSDSCPCPKPNFLFCRMCDARMRTRCCIRTSD